MAVDLIRSCYSTKMRFYRERPDIETWVDWFFVEPDAKLLPFRTAFNSGNWWSDKSTSPPLGEVAGAPRPWRNGQPPAPYDGQRPCGNDRKFIEGDALPPDPPVERLANGMPLCCAGAQSGLLYFGGVDTEMVPQDISVRYATTMDVYRFTNGPPAAPDVAGVGILLEADFHIRTEAGEGDAAVGHYTHTALVQGVTTNIRDDYNEGTRGANMDRVYIPDKTGTGFVVRFIEIVALEGSSFMWQRVYLDRKIPPAWPATA